MRRRGARYSHQIIRRRHSGPPHRPSARRYGWTDIKCERRCLLQSAANAYRSAMNISFKTAIAATLFSVALYPGLRVPAAHAAPASIGSPLPEFTHHGSRDWLNSPPLSVKGLYGSVVLVDFWAFECWNCYRSFPWLNTVADRYREKGLVVVGVHTPELDAEQARDGVVQSVHKYQLTNPIMLDNDYSYWNAVGNSYWPTFYLVDRRGVIRYASVGETHAGDDNAREMEAAVEQLLAEPGGR